MTPSTDWKEVIGDDEETRFNGYAQELRELQKRNARPGTRWRVLHAKMPAGLEAEFTVLPDIPEHARQGLFATPATYQAYVRFSNGSMRPQVDRKPDVRGIGVKLVGLPEEFSARALHGAPTQDFLLNRGEKTPFRNADDFVRFIVAAEQPIWLLPKLLWHFGIARTIKILIELLTSLKEPVLSLATEQFYSQLPIKFGPYAVRFTLAPRAEPLAEPPNRSDKDFLGEELAGRLQKGTVEYDFQVQFFQDEARTPIEDGSVAWSEEDAPCVTIGRLTLKQQDTKSPRGQRVAEFVESLSYNAWHTHEEFRPLGDMMRSRREAYRQSSMERGGVGEPDGSERFE